MAMFGYLLYCPYHIKCLTDLDKLPVVLEFYFNNVQFCLPRRVIMGLINHSLTFRGRVQSALFDKKTVLQFYFTDAIIEDISWLYFMGGYPAKVD